MEKLLLKQHDNFIKAVQYIVRITSKQDIYEHLARLMIKFFNVSWVVFAKFDENEKKIMFHHITIEEHDFQERIKSEECCKIVSEVLCSGFMAMKIIDIHKPYMTVFLPVLEKNYTKDVMLVAHDSSERPADNILNIYLALAGIAQTTIERLNYESELRKHHNHLEELVKLRTKELEENNARLKNEISERKKIQELLKNANEDLTDALKNLQLTQSQLIESEKMAALGQLIAGVAHEINSPLGAIRSAVDNISSTLKKTIDDQIFFFKNIPDNFIKAFDNLLKLSLMSNNSLSAREERHYRRLLLKLFDEQNIPESNKLSNYLVMMGIYKDVESFLPIFNDPKSFKIVDMAYKISGLSRSTKIIETAIERASKIVFALKNYGRYDQTGEMQMASIIDGIETVLTLYHNQLKQGIEVVKNYENIPLILCYPDELNQVWTNLLHNAIQAMDLNGVLTISILCKDNNLIISIKDTGKGISIENSKNIFKPFFTTKPAGEGSGLGLHIVKKILEKHQATISVESELNTGSCFTINIPIKTTE